MELSNLPPENLHEQPINDLIIANLVRQRTDSYDYEYERKVTGKTGIEIDLVPSYLSTKKGDTLLLDAGKEVAEAVLQGLRDEWLSPTTEPVTLDIVKAGVKDTYYSFTDSFGRKCFVTEVRSPEYPTHAYVGFYPPPYYRAWLAERGKLASAGTAAPHETDKAPVPTKTQEGYLRRIGRNIGQLLRRS